MIWAQFSNRSAVRTGTGDSWARYAFDDNACRKGLAVRSFVLCLAVLAAFSAGAKAQPMSEHARPETRLNTPPSTLNMPSLGQPTPSQQLQMQGYRDELQTRQRQLENQAGPQNPGVEVDALHNQERLNQLNAFGQPH
jgi:hypothetical protein